MICKSLKIVPVVSRTIVCCIIAINPCMAKVYSQYSIYKLAEYESSFIDSLREYGYHSGYSEFNFKGQKYIITYESLDDNSLALNINAFTKDFKSHHKFNAVLSNVIKGNFTNRVSIKNNDHVIFLVVKSESVDANGRISERNRTNFISYDAKNWQRLESISGLKDFHFRHISNDIIIGDGINTVGEPYSKEVYSVNNGLSWHNFGYLNMPGDNSYCNRILNVNNSIIYAKCQNNKETGLYMTDILQPNSLLKKINIPTQIIAKQNGHIFNLDISYFNTFDMGAYLLAHAFYWGYYQNNTQDSSDSYLIGHKLNTSQYSVSKLKTYLSKDKGRNWQEIDLNFDQQNLRAIDHKDHMFYLITDDYLNPYFDNKTLIKHLNGEKPQEKLLKSKVYLYKLTEDELIAKHKSGLKADLVFNKAMSKTNMHEYENSKILEINFLKNDRLKVGFYKLK